MKKQLILDTSIFVNPASAHVFGPTPTSAFIHFLQMASNVSHLECLMPPSIYSELMHFAEEASIPRKLLLVVHKKPPKKHEARVPGFFIYTLVDSFRDRVDRGLRLAERSVRDALEMAPPPKHAPHDGKAVRPDAELIGRLRDSYRRIMREGMLDSKADVDLLLLAYETGGLLVSADQGVLDWAESMGISILSHDHLFEFLQEEAERKTA